MQAEHFRDFDEFMASVRGVDCTMMLQNAARHSWQIQAADLAGVRVQLGRLGSGNIIEGQSYPDGYLIYLPLSETCEYMANGAAIPKNAFLIFEPGSEFSLSTKLKHDWCSSFIPADQLCCHPGLEEGRAPSDPMICRTTRPSRTLADRFRTSVHEILSTARNHPEFESSLAANVASAQLIDLGSTIMGCEHEREPLARGDRSVPEKRSSSERKRSSRNASRFPFGSSRPRPKSRSEHCVRLSTKSSASGLPAICN